MHLKYRQASAISPPAKTQWVKKAKTKHAWLPSTLSEGNPPI